MNKSLPLVFFGTENFSLPSLEALISGGYNVAAVVTRPDSRRGRGQRINEPAVKKLAQAAGIKLIQPLVFDDDLLKKLASLRPEAGVLVAYGKIIPQKVLRQFKTGIINAHPSLLPKYRGPSPIESAILNGDRTTGITIMRLSESMDAGPIYAQKTYGLSGNETRPALYGELAKLAADLLLEYLPAILGGKIQPVAQNEAAASYCKLLSRVDGIINPKRETAEQIERKVRAYLGYPKTRLRLLSHPVVITRAHPAGLPAESPLVIKCANNTFLAIDELIAPSGRRVSGADFLRGYRPL